MCFSAAFFEALLIWLVVVVAMVAVVKLLVPWILSKLGSDSGIIIAIVNIVLWAFVAIIVIKVVFMFIGCIPAMSLWGPGFHR